MSMKSICLAALSSILIAGGANAASVSVSMLDGDISTSTYGLHENTAATGASIAGSIVTANYEDGTSEELTWAQLGRWNGGVAGAFFEMSFERAEFLLTSTKRLTSFVLNAGAGGALFDTVKDGTVGSKWGYRYKEGTTGILDGLIDVVYSGLVNVAGDTNESSVYTTMTVDFSGTEGGGLFGTTSFSTDLDDLAFDGDLSPVSSVPLPGGLPLLLAGVVGLGFVKRRKS